MSNNKANLFLKLYHCNNLLCYLNYVQISTQRLNH